MNSDEAIGLLGMLGARPQFAHYKMDLEGAVRSWLTDLGDLPGPEVAAAVGALVRTHDAFPTIAAIRRHVAEERRGLPPAPDLAWLQVQAATSVSGLHPLVAGVTSALGGVTHCQANPELRFAFRGAYAEVHRVRVAEILAAPDLSPVGGVALPAGDTGAREWREDGPGLWMHLTPVGCGFHHADQTTPCPQENHERS
mgnify:CR=1 FL=1